MQKKASAKSTKKPTKAKTKAKTVKKTKVAEEKAEIVEETTTIEEPQSDVVVKEQPKKKRHSRLYIGFTGKLIIYIILFVVFLIPCLSFASKTLDRKKAEPINYNDSGKIEYKVYLKENEFYTEEYLDMNRAYIASLIDYIDIDFDYLFKIDNLSSLDFDYKIIGDLVIENSSGNNKYLEKEYVIMDSKTKKLENSKALNIHENAKIQYGYYNQLVNSFKSSYGVDINSYLKVYLKVDKKTVNDTVYKIADASEISLKIPLSEKAIEINLDVANQNVTKQIIPEGKVIFNKESLLGEIVFFIFASFFLAKIISYIGLLIKPKPAYDVYVDKLLKDYDRLIVETKTTLNLTNYNVIKIDKFTELLDVRDNLKLPIIYYNVVKHQKGIFYIKNNTDIYLLTIKSIDLEK